MATFAKRVSRAQRIADKLTRLDGGNQQDARRVKKEMVEVGYKVDHTRVGEAWRDRREWRGARGKAKRVHTPR